MTSLTQQMISEGKRVDPIFAIAEFMRIGGQTATGFNAKQATLYVGLMLEEMSETIECIADGAVDIGEETALRVMLVDLKRTAKKFKEGFFMGSVARANREELLDGMLDAAWVSIGAALSTSVNTHAAFREVARANMDKCPNGQVYKDENGKIGKPPGWRAPNHSSFIDVSDQTPDHPDR